MVYNVIKTIPIKVAKQIKSNQLPRYIGRTLLSENLVNLCLICLLLTAFIKSHTYLDEIVKKGPNAGR